MLAVPDQFTGSEDGGVALGGEQPDQANKAGGHARNVNYVFKLDAHAIGKHMRMVPPLVAMSCLGSCR